VDGLDPGGEANGEEKGEVVGDFFIGRLRQW